MPSEVAGQLAQAQTAQQLRVGPTGQALVRRSRVEPWLW